MRKKFITNIIFLLFLNLLVKPFWILGIDRSVQNELGPEVYGVYFALFNFSYLFQVILDFGINNYNNRNVARDPSTLSKTLVSTLLLKLLLGVVYTCILFISAIGIQFSKAQLGTLGLLALMQIALSFYSFLRSNINALHLFKTDAVLSVLDKLITSLICAWIIWGASGISMSIDLFIRIQIIGFAIAILVALLILLKQRLQIVWVIDKQLIRQIFKSSLPYALLGFLMTAYYRTDGVMLERMLGDEGPYQAGVYASAFRLLDAMSILGFLMAGLLMPMFSRMLANKESVKPLHELGFTLMLISSVPIGISSMFNNEPIMYLLYHHSETYAADIFWWLMISFIAISLTYVYGSLITAHGSIRTLNFISLGGFLLNILLNLFLIPKYMAIGSSVATVISQVIILAFHVIIVHRIFKFDGTVLRWIRSLLYMGGVIGLNFLIQTLNLGWAWEWEWASAIILGVCLALPVGIIRISDLKGIRQLLSPGATS